MHMFKSLALISVSAFLIFGGTAHANTVPSSHAIILHETARSENSHDFIEKMEARRELRQKFASLSPEQSLTLKDHKEDSSEIKKDRHEKHADLHATRSEKRKAHAAHSHTSHKK